MGARPKAHALVARLAMGALSAAAIAAPAHAFQIDGGFTDGCHERITLKAYQEFLGDFPADRIPVPDSQAWRELSDDVATFTELPLEEEGLRVLFFSLLVGVRAPDTAGHSLIDLDALREAHLDPTEQYVHALRAPEDDGPDGDVAAIDGTRAYIFDRVEAVQRALALPEEDQLMEVTIYLDFYDRVPVEVWAPAFHVGEALHTLQDAFSHTIRSDDLRRVRHVMTYLDALDPAHDERRDGMAHSTRLDDCEGEVHALELAATEACVQFLLALRNRLTGVDVPEALTLDEVLDEWMTHEPGCTLDNGYCGSWWVGLAREGQTVPILSCEGCAAGPGAASATVSWTLALLGWMLARRRRLGAARGAST